VATNNPNFSTLIATTLQNFSNKIADNVTTNITLTRYLKKAGNIKVVGGGRKFVHPIFYAKNSSFAARGKLDTISTPVTDPITDSEWDIKVLDGSIVLPTLDVAMNSGKKEQLLNYVQAKKMEAEVSMSELLSDQAWNTSVGTNDFDSIPRHISETPSADSDVGGIDSTAGNATWWRNYSHDTAVSAFNTSQAGINAIDTSVNASTFGIQGPKLIVTTKAIFTLYMLGLTSNVRYAKLDEGDAAFRALQYATMPFVADDDCVSGNLYGIDTENTWLQVLGMGNMKQTMFQFKTDQLAESALMYFFANISSGSRRTNFVIDSITG